MTRGEPHFVPLSNSGARLTRRSVLSMAGAVTALPLLAECRRPAERIVPNVARPEQLIPGRPLHYATAIALMGTAFGLLVETHDGRPTKVEGNPLHPATLGTTSSFLQASIMQLYDADRSRSVVERGQARDWQSAATKLASLGQSLKAERGRSLLLLTNDHRSPTLSAAIAALKRDLPEAQVCAYSTFDRSTQHAGAELAFNRRLEAIYDFSKADIVIALDADPLGLEGSPLRAARQWAEQRVPERGAMNRWYVIEGGLTMTGSISDHRFRCAATDIPKVLCALVLELHARRVLDIAPTLLGAVSQMANGLPTDTWRPRVSSMASELERHRSRSLVLVGTRQSRAIHALANWLNYALDNQGNSVEFVPCFDERLRGLDALAETAERLRTGATKHIVIIGANPSYDAPHELGFTPALALASTSMHLGQYVDETALACSWHINQAHEFESWGDVVSDDGSASIVQPLISPLFNGRTSVEVVRSIVGQSQSAYDSVREYWKLRLDGTEFEATWRRALRDGIVPGPSLEAVPVTPIVDRIAAAVLEPMLRAGEGYEIAFYPDAHTYDGTFANNAWLHELPEPFTKVTWGNVAKVSRAIAAKYELSDGDLVSLGIDAYRTIVPVVIAPGQADNVISLTLGHGRTAGGRIASNTGYAAQALRRVASPFLSRCTRFERHKDHIRLARTQEEFGMHGRDPVRVTHASALQTSEALSALRSVAATTNGDRAFGLSIDLSRCTGCGSCATACQAENNISIVGAEGVRQRRHMHWLRVDRYFEGDGDTLAALSQPVLCQQCTNAPCETVCPAGATVHSPDGLNDMVYNRCVGSRYCANNCPFKVRRFNYFEYWGAIDAPRRMQLNPDVTVRSRGVMEKCTFCVQRVNAAKIVAKRNGTLPVDGDIVLACEQACPTGAIVFGELNDKQSRVAKVVTSPRAYRLLDELNLDAHVHYLAKAVNPNPELKS